MKLRKCFTLIEALVVLAISAIIATLAISTYNGVFDGTSEKNVLNTLRAFTVVQKSNVENRGYFLDAGELTQKEPDYKFTEAATTDKNIISVKVDLDSTAVGMGMLNGQECTLIKLLNDDSNAPDLKSTTTGECSGQAALTITEGQSW